MKNLTLEQIEHVNGGVFFLPALGKGILMGITSGAALFGVAIGAASYYNPQQ